MANQEKTIGEVRLIREFCVKIVGESGGWNSEKAQSGRMCVEGMHFYWYAHLHACSGGGNPYSAHDWDFL